MMEKLIYNSGNGNVLTLYREKTLSDYNEMLSAFRAQGFVTAQGQTVEGLVSETLIKGSESISISFDSRAGEIRSVLDPFSAVLETSYRKAGKCPVRMWQFEVDHTLIDCGMCYIIQCTDYSFFVIDSAHFYSLNDDRRLYELLRKETPADMPVVISGWYLSHGHADHICKCLDFLMQYKEVEVRGLYYNFVPDDHFSAEGWLIADRKHTELFNREVEKMTHIPKYKLHAGQYFYVDCLRFDVLCTQEDVYPGSLEDYNNSSLVVMMTVDGDKVSFPGDASGLESEILERRYNEALRCDIMQVSHHGHFGTSSEYYRRSGARVALFPVTEIKFHEEYPRIEANRVACEIARHTIIASHGTAMFTFPLEGSEILIYPDETNESFEGVYNLWNYEYSEEYKKKLTEEFRARNKFYKIEY